MRRVGLALRETPEIPELALADRNRHVGERRGSLNLLHEARRRLARGRRHRVRPRVLRLQMSPDLGVVCVAQPIPRVIKMLPELVAHPVAVTLRGNRGSVWRGLGCVVRGRLSHGDHLRGGRGPGRRGCGLAACGPGRGGWLAARGGAGEDGEVAAAFVHNVQHDCIRMDKPSVCARLP